MLLTINRADQCRLAVIHLMKVAPEDLTTAFANGSNAMFHKKLC